MTIRFIETASEGLPVPADRNVRDVGALARAVSSYEGSIRAAAGPRYEGSRPGIPEFDLTAEQVEVDAAVEEVGWVGYYSAVVSTLGAMCEFYPEWWDGEKWVDVSGSLLHAEWREFFRPAGPIEAMTEEQWVARDLELLLTIGEFAAWPTADSSGTYAGWVTAHPISLMRGPGRGTFLARMREDARPGGVGMIEAPLDTLTRAWVPDRRFPDQARVPLGRVLPEIRLFRSVLANLQRASDSRLLMNGLLYIPTNESDLEEGFDPADDVGDFMSGVPDTPEGGGLGPLIENLGKFSRRAWADPKGNDIAKVAPFPFPHHTKPEIVELGRAVDEDTLATLAVLIESAARGINIPMDFLTAGVGEANHWNSAEKRRALNSQAVFPLVDTYLAWWTRRFRIWLDSKSFGDSSRVRIARNSDPITIKPDNGPQILAAHKLVGFRRQVIAEAVGLGAEDLAELPEDTTETDFSLAMLKAPGVTLGSGVAAEVVPPDDQVTASALSILSGSR